MDQLHPVAVDALMQLRRATESKGTDADSDNACRA